MELPVILPTRRKTYKQLDYADPRNYKYISRYYKTKRIVSDKDGTEYHETYQFYDMPITNQDTYYTVDPTTENRIDLISFKHYNTVSYWWAIAMANDLLDPFDIPIGTVLRIPTITTLYNRNGVLSK